MDNNSIIWNGYRRYRTIFSIIRIYHSILFKAGKPIPSKFVDKFQVIVTGIPAVEHNKIRLKSSDGRRMKHLTKMVVL